MKPQTAEAQGTRPPLKNNYRTLLIKNGLGLTSGSHEVEPNRFKGPKVH